MKLLHTIAVFASFWMPHQQGVDVPLSTEVGYLSFHAEAYVQHHFWEVRPPMVILWTDTGKCTGGWGYGDQFAVFCPKWAIDAVMRHVKAEQKGETEKDKTSLWLDLLFARCGSYTRT